MGHSVVIKHYISGTVRNRPFDRLNLDSDEKSALAASEFHTLTIRSVKKLRLFKFSHCALYSLYGYPLVDNDVNVKYRLTS